MDAEKKAWLYELDDNTFKEWRVTIKPNKTQATKAIAIFDKDPTKAIDVSSEEGKVYKFNVVWLEKRSKEQAAYIFRAKINREINKHISLIDNLKTRVKMADNYIFCKMGINK